VFVKLFKSLASGRRFSLIFEITSLLLEIPYNLFLIADFEFC